jgi:nucleotide-binding universal stress UspA family protein
MTQNSDVSTRRIVVGIDGSESSADVLAWAAHQATLTGSTLEAVMSWEWPNTYGAGYYVPDNYSPDIDAHKMLDDAVEKVRGTFPELVIKRTVVEGHPAPALVDASVGADLLVVGSRGRGEFSGMLLGSVSEYCTHHVSCPITIVR